MRQSGLGFFFLERRNKTHAVFNTTMPSQFHKYPGHVPADTLAKATEACKRPPPKAVEMLCLSLYQDLGGLTSWTHLPSSLQEFVLLPCPILNSAEAWSRGWQGVKPLAPQPCRAAGPRRGWLALLHHTDAGSNHGCPSTGAASFSHGGGRKPDLNCHLQTYSLLCAQTRVYL